MFEIFIGHKKWFPLEIEPPPTKLRGKTVNRTNSEYSATEQLMNGNNGYIDDYKSSKYGSSMLRERNRSQRRDKRMADSGDRYGKVGANYPTGNGASGNASHGATKPLVNSQFVSIENDPNKKNLPASISTTLAPSTLNNATYPRRNTGPRGRPRGIIPPRNLNRSRSQTGSDIVPSIVATGVSTATDSTGTTTATTIVSPNTTTSEEFASNDMAYYYEYRNTMDMNNMPITQTPQTAPPFLSTPYYFNTPYPIYTDPERTKNLLQQQIEYYFSEENLQRDFFLRRKMDEQGFLPISLIASFHRVQALTQDVALVVESLSNSTAVEVVDGVKVRTRVNPEQWPLVSVLSFNFPIQKSFDQFSLFFVF